jgi:hypothetical protein
MPRKAKINKCRAKDVSKCPYHGAELRWNQALDALSKLDRNSAEFVNVFKEAETARKDMDNALNKSIDGVWSEEPPVRNQRIRISSLSHGDQVVISFKNSSNKEKYSETASFNRHYTMERDGYVVEYAEFISRNEQQGGEFTWSAYRRWDNKWAYGSSAEPMSIKSVTKAKDATPKAPASVDEISEEDKLELQRLDTIVRDWYYEVRDNNSSLSHDDAMELVTKFDKINFIDGNDEASEDFWNYYNSADGRNMFNSMTKYVEAYDQHNISDLYRNDGVRTKFRFNPSENDRVNAFRKKIAERQAKVVRLRQRYQHHQKKSQE